MKHLFRLSATHRLTASVVTSIASALLLSSTTASAQMSEHSARAQAGHCDCSRASLVGQESSAGFGNHARHRAVVSSGIEFPSAGPLFGAAGPSPRWDINVSHNDIRIDFVQQVATYGGNARFTFDHLYPRSIHGSCGQPYIAGMSVYTNKPGAASYVKTGASFTAHSVTLPITNGGNTNWNPGEWIVAKLHFACQAHHGHHDHHTHQSAVAPTHTHQAIANGPASMVTNVGFLGTCPPINQRWQRADFAHIPFLNSRTQFFDQACRGRNFHNGVALAMIGSCVAEPRPNNPDHSRANVKLWCAP